MCMELLSVKNLHDYIIESGPLIDEQKSREFGLKIGQALEYLHENGVILRNLEASSILMTDESSSDIYESQYPKICRMDKAHVMGVTEVTRGIFGDIRFRAPEVILGKAYNFKADCWSFGVILFHMLTGKLPFTIEEEPRKMIVDSEDSQSLDSEDTVIDKVHEIENMVLNHEPNYNLLMQKGCSRIAIDLVSKLLHKDPETRLGIGTALKHNWFKVNLDMTRSEGKYPEKDVGVSVNLMAMPRKSRRMSINL
eukprot:CAMPEP_0170497968 /NCGR_PEP_ID=MMETSP0208-20121228/26374_1 /TAXON_ID=197538 /ORGANISM="Strombidium inclinatum, Strain S3" /LENGTH=252 /DNA_ID=CAMNT_0010774969 /DNA_START=3160 /DNA_END=3914 /DNA_ORIENTATION=+